MRAPTNTILFLSMKLMMSVCSYSSRLDANVSDCSRGGLTKALVFCIPLPVVFQQLIRNANAESESYEQLVDGAGTTCSCLKLQQVLDYLP